METTRPIPDLVCASTGSRAAWAAQARDERRLLVIAHHLITGTEARLALALDYADAGRNLAEFHEKALSTIERYQENIALLQAAELKAASLMREHAA